MTERLQKAMEAAAKIAKAMPENLQQVAFNRALDALLGAETPSRAQAYAHTKAPAGQASSKAGNLERLQEIDRTRHADVSTMSRVADQALRILQIAKDELNLDGLTAGEIAATLTDKFRITTSTSAVLMALNRETKTVNPARGPQGKLFRIMAPGEDHLKRLRSGQQTERLKQAKPAKTPKASGSKERAARRSTVKGGRPGPKAALDVLLASGFFRTPKSMAEVRKELQHKRGYSYALGELSPTLVRAVRAGLLDRERSDDGQYLYTKA